MTDPYKNLQNPLFKNSVTNSTVEDFSQNALLLPAQEKLPPAPVPASTGGVNVPPQNLPPQTSVNSYRRLGTKRPAYAQVPGLSTNQQQPPPPASDLFLPPSVPAPQSVIEPTINNSENIFSPSVTNPLQPASYFNTVNAPPSAFDLSAPTQPQLFTPAVPLPGTSSTLQSPVMTAIPAAELQPVLNSGSAEDSLGITNMSTAQMYRPVYNHWFYRKEVEGKVLWRPFSMVDSLALEEAFTSNDLDPDKIVATDGGRYDVNILRRQRVPVYWKGPPTEVRRCSWFFKSNSDGRFIPYEENIATKLEEEYKTAFEISQWHRKVELPSGEAVVFHGPDVLVQFSIQSGESWENTQNQQRQSIVKRGMDEFDIDEGEPAQVDHLLFLVHGIGSVCDLKFRTVEEVVDEFRSIALQLTQSHYRSSCDRGVVNRIEVLPISWHKDLHSENTGIDRKLKSITLDSITRLRDFTNDTLLDILFYTSPVYCQTIMTTVGDQLNKIYELFKTRNPDFNGGVSLGGHSLGSLILFDLLCHQHPEAETTPENEDESTTQYLSKPSPSQRKMSKRISYMMGTVGTGQPQLHYPHLNFQPNAFFALGSPIGMFVTVRGLDTLGEQFSLPTCRGFFNIFHPYDPVAYRVEPLINSELTKLKPVLIPHHKGRKRMHLELKETVARVGADLKQRVIDSMKNTWNSFYQLAMFHRSDPGSLEAEVDKALQDQLRQKEALENESFEPQRTDLPLGSLNDNRRIDYVLQEAPFEIFNEYIFALTSHVCYWESEDTVLLILAEIYRSMNVSTDDKIPQQSMTIEKPLAFPKAGAASKIHPTQSEVIEVNPVLLEPKPPEQINQLYPQL